jgi:site-specific DNA-methyltransferase (adenine-specific)
MISRVECGDSLELLKSVEKNSIQTIYFDPPFNSGRDYKLAVGSEIGFSDEWDSDSQYEAWIENFVILCKDTLKKDGTFFFHISAAEMFIPEKICRRNFKYVQPIFWKKSRSKNNVKKKLGATIDIIFKCSMAKQPCFNMVYQPLNEYYAKNSYKNKDSRGNYALGHLVNDKTRKTTNKKRLYTFEIGDRSWTPSNGWRLSEEDLQALLDDERVHVPKGKANLYRKIYKHESKGKPCTDLWDDIHSIAQGAKDARKYPTAKPVPLLERIIKMSSNEGDIILDPVAGSGTTGVAAKNLNRNYILFDINTDAHSIMKHRGL